MWYPNTRPGAEMPASAPRRSRQAFALPVRPPQKSLQPALPLRHINTNQLRRFVLLMHHRSAIAAERHSGIRAACILYAIRRVEERLGITLFTREATTMQPTAAAIRLYPCAIRLLLMWDSLMAEMRSPRNSATPALPTAPAMKPAS